MSRIRILDPLVVDRIAAGEVVERPASVVKELIDNALDAGATRIAVQLEESGIGLIEVADNGCGMDAEDVELAFAQHATSKVSTVEDLEAIATMGFRGEALASIGAVARVELSTATGEGPGVRLRVEGGVRQEIERLAWPRGTTVRVADLFFNTPARRKSLKKPATELRHTGQTVSDYALGRPDIHMSLAHGKRTLLAAPPVATLIERVHQVLGAEVAEHWLEVQADLGSLSIRGGVTTPELQRPHRNDIRLFVNGRPVSDYRLGHALTSAYDTLLDARRFPVGVIHLDLPAAAVDVNVHPRKAEVRFADPDAVYRGMRRAVREALARHMPPVRIRPSASTPARADTAGIGATGDDSSSWPGRAEGRSDGESRVDLASRRGDAATSLPGDSRQLPVEDWIVAEGAQAVAAASEAGSQSAAGEARPAIRGTAGAIRPLAQYANTYILAADEHGLLIIDQHVAHERVLYEQVLAQLDARNVEAQHLLVPETVELSAAEAALVETHAPLLESVGFVLEPFGGNAWAIRTAPAILAGRDLSAALRALLDSLEEGRGPEALEEARRELAASISCHAAVRANHPLSREEMVRLIADLERCESPTRCPHGRPILLRVDHADLEKRIGRH
jgi:DNA mismatch repair protein MutL